MKNKHLTALYVKAAIGYNSAGGLISLLSRKSAYIHTRTIGGPSERASA